MALWDTPLLRPGGPVHVLLWVTLLTVTSELPHVGAPRPGPGGVPHTSGLSEYVDAARGPWALMGQKSGWSWMRTSGFIPQWGPDLSPREVLLPPLGAHCRVGSLGGRRPLADLRLPS